MKKRTQTRGVSLARVLSKLGFCSRKEAERMIIDGNVTVNGRTIDNPAYRCSMEHDVVGVEGNPLRAGSRITIAMNKPAGVVTTRADELGRRTIYDTLGEIGRWVFPVGRLDRETSGLLIMTNNHQLGERLTNPGSKIPKTYVAELNDKLPKDALRALEAGMILDGERLLPARIRDLGGRKVEIAISEGKNRQIRRMFHQLGLKVVSLKRIRIGDLDLDGLKTGNWKYLTEDEVKLLSTRKGILSRKDAKPKSKT